MQNSLHEPETSVKSRLFGRWISEQIDIQSLNRDLGSGRNHYLFICNNSSNAVGDTEYAKQKQILSYS